MRIILLLLLIPCIGFTKPVTRMNMKADTLGTPGKDALSKSLVQLRDSVDALVVLVDQKADNSSPRNKQVLDNAAKDLRLQRSSIEKMIEEVVVANDHAWTSSKHNEALTSLRQSRDEINRIGFDIKDLLTAKENSYK